MPLDSNITFGARVFQRRVDLGLTQAELARAASLSPGYLSAIENDRVAPPAVATCRRLAHALCIEGTCSNDFAALASRQRRAVGVRLPKATPPHLRNFIVQMVGRAEAPTPTVLAALMDVLNGGRP